MVRRLAGARTNRLGYLVDKASVFKSRRDLLDRASIGLLKALMNNWIYLLIAGVFEIGFTTCLKLCEGFTRHGYTLAFLVLAAGSFALLNRAITTIPIGTAYAVWTGIGACGTALVGMYLFGESTSLLRILLLTNLVASIIGLKLIG